MSKSEFDDLLRKKITEEDLEYDPENWRRLSQLLPPALPDRSKKWTIGLGIAAALALLLATTLLVKLMDQTSQVHPSDQSLSARTQQEQNLADNPPNKPVASEIKSKTQEDKDVTIRANSGDTDPVADIKETRNEAETSHAGKGEAGMKQPAPAMQAGTTAFVPGGQIPENKAKDLSYQKATEATNLFKGTSDPSSPPHPPVRIAVREQQRNRFVPESYAPHKPGTGSQTSVAFGGGVNYGSLNAGYSLNVTAQQKIGDHFFFDGTIAVMYNNNTPNNIVNYGAAPTPDNTAARPSQKMMLSTPAVAPVSSLYYIQFNPSFGYQLADNVDISIGGDLQQMLSPDNELQKYQVSEEGTRVFPGLDLGFTGKTEYSITPQIQAGLIFREGLNNLLRPNRDIPFVNRRYVQVQFKYNIPIRR